MTTTTTEGRPAEETLVRELEPRLFHGRCCVRHEDAGGRCDREATLEVYGLLFCEVHGPEVRVGALGEVYFDAGWFVEYLDTAGGFAQPNPALVASVKAANVDFMRRSSKEDVEDDVLRRAYRLLPERVDPETVEHYSDRDWPGKYHYEAPYDHYLHVRMLIHHLMRVAYQDGARRIVEILERERERVAAQAAYASVYLDEWTERQKAVRKAGEGERK